MNALKVNVALIICPINVCSAFGITLKYKIYTRFLASNIFTFTGMSFLKLTTIK